MDSVTHLAAGALTPFLFKNAPRTRSMILFGVLCGEFPDIDVLAGHGPETLLTMHRGLTHSLVAQPFFALLLALLFHPLIKRSDPAARWSWANTWTVAFLALLLHLFLDCMTTFGTMVLLPFSAVRIAFPAMYIVDLLLTLPLLFILFHLLRRGMRVFRIEEESLSFARLGISWVLLYPLLALACNHSLAAWLTKSYAAPGNVLGITSVRLLPEPFSPLNWKFVGTAKEHYYMAQFLVPVAGRPLEFSLHARVDEQLWRRFQKQIPLFEHYASFVSFPAQRVEEDSSGKVYTFYDLRYENTLRGLMAALGREKGMFLMRVRVDDDGKALAYQFLFRGQDAASSPWELLPPQKSGSIEDEND